MHYEGPIGRLCSWEGGIPGGSTDEPCTCRQCINIVDALWRLWFPRTALPDHGAPT